MDELVIDVRQVRTAVIGPTRRECFPGAIFHRIEAGCMPSVSPPGPDILKQHLANKFGTVRAWLEEQDDLRDNEQSL